MKYDWSSKDKTSFVHRSLLTEKQDLKLCDTLANDSPAEI